MTSRRLQRDAALRLRRRIAGDRIVTSDSFLRKQVDRVLLLIGRQVRVPKRRLIGLVPKLDVLEGLHLRVQVEKGVKDVAEGRVISHTELKNQLANRAQVVTMRLLPYGRLGGNTDARG